jgi:hypothetical protein
MDEGFKKTVLGRLVDTTEIKSRERGDVQMRRLYPSFTK